MRKTFFVLSLLFILSCEKKQDKKSTVSTDHLKSSHEKIDSKKDILSKEEVLKKTNEELLKALKTENYNTFANYIHPQKGVRFSMYAFVDKNEDKHFSKEDFEISAFKNHFYVGIQRRIG